MEFVRNLGPDAMGRGRLLRNGGADAAGTRRCVEGLKNAKKKDTLEKKAGKGGE